MTECIGNSQTGNMIYISLSNTVGGAIIFRQELVEASAFSCGKSRRSPCRTKGSCIWCRMHWTGIDDGIKGLATDIFDFHDIQNAMDQSTQNKTKIVKSVIKISE